MYNAPQSDKVDAVFIILENEIIGTPPAKMHDATGTNKYKLSGGVVIAAMHMTRSEYGFIDYIRFDESTSCHSGRRKINATNLY